jgi:hypothetical protein
VNRIVQKILTEYGREAMVMPRKQQLADAEIAAKIGLSLGMI